MPCTVQQGAHICLVSPSNVHYQHACETRNQMSFNLLNYDKTKKNMQNNKGCFTVRFNSVKYAIKCPSWLLHQCVDI